MGQRNEAEVGGDTRDLRLAGSMSAIELLASPWRQITHRMFE